MIAYRKMRGSSFLGAEILAGNQKIPVSLCRTIAKFAILRFRDEEKKCFLPTSLFRVYFPNSEKVPIFLTAKKVAPKISPPPPKRYFLFCIPRPPSAAHLTKKGNLENRIEGKAEEVPAFVETGKRHF